MVFASLASFFALTDFFLRKFVTAPFFSCRRLLAEALLPVLAIGLSVICYLVFELVKDSIDYFRQMVNGMHWSMLQFTLERVQYVEK